MKVGGWQEEGGQGRQVRLLWSGPLVVLQYPGQAHLFLHQGGSPTLSSEAVQPTSPIWRPAWEAPPQWPAPPCQPGLPEGSCPTWEAPEAI